LIGAGGLAPDLYGLRLVFVVDDIAPISGGVPAVVRQLSLRVAEQGATVQLVYAHGELDDLTQNLEGFAFRPHGLGRMWSWGAQLSKGVAQLSQNVGSGPTLFHLHGIWAAPQYFAARAAHANGVPFIVSAHGMLEPWLWNEQGWRIWAKKKAYWAGLAYPALSKATIIHAITPLERDHLRVLFPKNQIEVIPNAIDVTEVDEIVPVERSKTILFLGRIEPKKGVDILIQAFAKAKLPADWNLRIAGPVWSSKYLVLLEKLVRSLELEDRVKFSGPVFGDDKREMLQRAWVMAVPSHSEVVGLVNLEAAIFRLPTITTPNTGLQDWESGGGILVSPDVDALFAALQAACAWSDHEQFERGLASRRLVLDRYSWRAVLPQWTSLYSSLRQG